MANIKSNVNLTTRVVDCYTDYMKFDLKKNIRDIAKYEKKILKISLPTLFTGIALMFIGDLYWQLLMVVGFVIILLAALLFFNWYSLF